MFFDNPEGKHPKDHSPEGGGTAHGSDPAHSKGFPTHADPTQAFEEDSTGVATGQATPDEIASLKQTLKELDEKAQLNYDRYLRALAELENYKKRMARERTELMRYAGEDLLVEILPVIDNLERTLAHLKDDVDVNKIQEGLNLVYKQFQQTLEKSGVTRIEEAAVAFNPAVHQALQRVEDKSVAEDTVVEVLQKGYCLNGKVVRPAMVKVSKH